MTTQLASGGTDGEPKDLNSLQCVVRSGASGDHDAQLHEHMVVMATDPKSHSLLGPTGERPFFEAPFPEA